MAELKPLIDLMAALRDPETGCPWDLRQDNRSIAPWTLEETCELLNAIEADDAQGMREELGDLLFHVVFHARIAEEAGRFAIGDVIDGIVAKMRRRHPHVFDPDHRKPVDEAHLAEQWRQQKQREKGDRPRGLAQIGQQLPALPRAQQLTAAASGYHFDWPAAEPVLDKLDEEIGELREAVAAGDRDAIEDELGDVLFVAVNLARKLDLDAEAAMRRVNQKFIRRFQHVLDRMHEDEQDFTPQQLERMEDYWREAKRIEKGGKP
jgi:MazG family protein